MKSLVLPHFILVLISTFVVGCGSGGGGGGSSGPDAALFQGPLMFISTQMRVYGTSDLKVADLNGDAAPDLIVRTNSSLSELGDAVSVTLGSPTKLLETSTIAADPCDTAHIADFDGDGINDFTCMQTIEVIPDEEYTFDLVVYYGLGDGEFSGPNILESLASSEYPFAVGDVNGDSLPDIVLRLTNTHTWLNDGGRTFTLVDAPIAVPFSFRYTLADINGDTLEDLVVPGSAMSTDPMYAALSNGDGTFDGNTELFPAAPDFLLEPADIDGDGALDFVGIPEDNGITVYLGAGDGTFPNAVVTPLSNEYIESTPRHLADFDEDGHLDLVFSKRLTSCQCTHVLLALGNGDGTFQPGTVVFQGGTGQSQSADMDLDGRLDLLLSVSGFIQVLFGSGDGTFRNAGPVVTQLPEDSFIQSFDLDGDNNLDVRNLLDDHIEVLYGRGDGTFEPAITENLGIAADLDNDDDLDFFSAFADTTDSFLTIIRNYGSRDFRALPPIEFFDSEIQGSYWATDVDSDGNADILFSQTESGIFVASWIAWGLGDMQFEPMAMFSESAFRLEDVTGDGLNDLVDPATTFGSIDAISVRPNLGGRTFGPAVVTKISYPAGATAGGGYEFTDVNGDDRSDMFLAALSFTSPGTILQVFLGQSDGAFIASPSMIFDPLTLPELADIDGDGDIDIVMVTFGMTDGIRVIIPLINDGNGTFTQRTSTLLFNVSAQLPAFSFGFQLVDISGDGIVDVLGNMSLPDVLGVALGQGDGTFAAPNYFGIPNAYDLHFGDYDRDGDGDFIAVVDSRDAFHYYENAMFD